MTKKEILDAFILITFTYTGDEGKFDPEAHLRVVGYCDESITLTDGEKTETLSWDEVKNDTCTAEEDEVEAVTNSFGIFVLEVQRPVDADDDDCDCEECNHEDPKKGLMFITTDPTKQSIDMKTGFLNDFHMLSSVGARYMKSLVKDDAELVQKYIELVVMPILEKKGKMRQMLEGGGNPMAAIAALLGGGRNKPA